MHPVEQSGRAVPKGLRGQERKVGVNKSEYLALDWGRETSLKNNLKKPERKPKKRPKAQEEKWGAGKCMYMCVCMTT